MAAQDEVKWLDLLRIRLSCVKLRQRPQQLGAAHGYLPQGHAIGEG